MRISGAHMNYGFMHKLQQRQDQGEDLGAASALLENRPGRRLGQVAVINPAKDGLTPAATALANAPGQVKKQTDEQTLGETFANEIIRRMGEVTDENGEAKDTGGLRDQLASTMDWVRDRFGDDTAAAAAGMIIKSTSSGVTEETLGDGLLNVLKFIDRNFGTNAGDQAIAKFNSGINPTLNEFFDNGLNETFHVAESSGGASQSAAGTFAQAAQSADGTVADAQDELNDILDKLKGELDNIAQLQDLTTQLEEQFNPAKADVAKALQAYQAAPGDSGAQFTDMSV